MTNRMPTPPEARKVIVGVDTHKHVHVAVAIDSWGIRLRDQAFVADSGGYQALITWAETHGRIEAFGIEGTGSYGAGLARAVRRAGHRGRGSESGRPAHATHRRQVRHHRRGGRRAVRPGGSVDGHPQDRGRRRRDDAPVEDHTGYRGEGAHHGDEHTEADRRARPAGPARSPPRPHRSRSAHALRRTPTGPHRHAHRGRQAHPPGARPPLDGSHRGNGATRPASRAPHDRDITDPPCGLRGGRPHRGRTVDCLRR